MNFSNLNLPAFMMAPPTSINPESVEANNIWMKEMSKEERMINKDDFFNQWLELYQTFSSIGYVDIMTPPAGCELQDLVFTANSFAILPFLGNDKKQPLLLSSFASKPRVGEEDVILNHVKNWDYDIIIPKEINSEWTFEGYADLKLITPSSKKDGKPLYIGLYGQRSSKEFYEWLEKEYDITIIKTTIPLEEGVEGQADDYAKEALYHGDCGFMVLNQNAIMLCEVHPQETFDLLEEHEIEINEVSFEHSAAGICNSILFYGTIVNASDINDLDYKDPEIREDYYKEKSKNDRLFEIAVEYGLEVKFVNLSQAFNLGGLLSCFVADLNYYSYLQERI